MSGTADGAVLRLVRYWTGGPVPFTYLLADPFVLYGNLWPGSLYGGIVGAGPGALGDILEIPLNADGLAAINASRGMFFNMGGMLLADPVADSPESATLLLVVGFWGGRRKRGA